MSKVIDVLKSNIKVIIVFILILCFVIFFFSKNSLKKKTTYTVIDGTIEQSDETNLYVLKNETLVDYDSTQPVTAIVDGTVVTVLVLEELVVLSLLCDDVDDAFDELLLDVELAEYGHTPLVCKCAG